MKYELTFGCREFTSPAVEALLRLLKRRHVIAMQLDIGDGAHRLLESRLPTVLADAPGRVGRRVDRNDGDEARRRNAERLEVLLRTTGQIDRVQQCAKAQVVGNPPSTNWAYLCLTLFWY